MTTRNDWPADARWKGTHGNKFAVPTMILRLIEKGRLFDQSNEKDAVPCFDTSPHVGLDMEEGTPGVTLFVGAPRRREEDEYRYNLYSHEGFYCECTMVGETNDLSEALRLLEEHRPNIQDA